MQGFETTRLSNLFQSNKYFIDYVQKAYEDARNQNTYRKKLMSTIAKHRNRILESALVAFYPFSIRSKTKEFPLYIHRVPFRVHHITMNRSSFVDLENLIFTAAAKAAVKRILQRDKLKTSHIIGLLSPDETAFLLVEDNYISSSVIGIWEHRREEKQLQSFAENDHDFVTYYIDQVANDISGFRIGSLLAS